MNRRAIVAAGMAAGGLLLSRRAASLAETAPARPGTPYPLVALPGKAPLGQVYDIPPNYETPTPHLIGTERYPFTDNAYYYVRHREAVPPQIPPDQFRLQIGGDRVAKPQTLTLDDLRRFPTVELGAVGQCGGYADGLFRPLVPGVPWTKGDLSCAVWTGASLQAVLEAAGIRPGAIEVAFTAAGTTIARKKPKYVQTYAPSGVLQPQAMLAYAMNGQDIPIWNGYPLRVVVPGTFAPRWMKQVVSIEVRSAPDPDDWSEGAPGEGTLPTYSLITDPPDGTRAAVGQAVALRGVAWDAGQGIASVETSVDGGASWQVAALEPSYGKYVWRVWHQTVRIGRAGQFPILSRATSVDGATQALDVDGQHWNAARPLAAILIGA
jgi:sulfite dehydrogenase (cytochrome) subunit A